MTETKLDQAGFPPLIRQLIYDTNAIVCDCSFSASARVFRIVASNGNVFYAKVASTDVLNKEVPMMRTLNMLGLAPPVIVHVKSQHNLEWIVTKSALGENAMSPRYLDKPYQLAATLGRALRVLHESDITMLPTEITMSFSDRSQEYRKAFEKACRLTEPHYERKYLCGLPEVSRRLANATFGELVSYAKTAVLQLSNDCLIHGDACLPNIILDDWELSGFIDAGLGGLGDRHIDVFWCLWSLSFNTNSEDYGDTLLDAYGRHLINNEILCGFAALETVLSPLSQ